MGTLTCSGWSVEFDDRVLAHLHIVIVNRFRRGEPVLVSWIDSTQVGSGRSSVWLTPNATTCFRFDGSRVPSIDRAWLALLGASAASSTGLIVTDEHGEPVRVGRSTSGRIPASALNARSTARATRR